MALDIVSILIGLLTTIIILVVFAVPALWISGRLLAGKHNAKFTDAVWIVVLGAVVLWFFNIFVASLISGLVLTLLSYFILLIIWLGLVKHFFDCGWLRALAISIIAVIIAIVFLVIIAFVLALIGLGASLLPVPPQFSSF